MLPFVLCLTLFGADDQQRQADSILQGTEPTVEAMLAIIGRRQLDARDGEQLQRWLVQLRDNRFQTREQATAALLQAGVRAKPLAEAALLQAKAAVDSEWMDRLEYLLERWAAFDDSQLIWAAAVKLKVLPATSGVSRRLVDALASLHSRFLQAPVREAAWIQAQAEDVPWLKQRVQSPDPIQRATALCMLAKFRQQPDCVELLKDEQLEVRLAAARVLTHIQVGKAVDPLLELVGHERHELRAEARYLLRALHEAREGSLPDAAMTLPQWTEWITAKRQQLAPLAPEAAFRWGVLQLGLREDFNVPMANVKSYQAMRYSSTLPAKAVVKGGRLYLDGNHDEGDQLLTISAKALVSTPTLTAPFIVKAGMGGQIGNNVGWHVGVAVGNAKILFHPVYSGGAFRVEHVNTHGYYVQNTTMPFTPQADAIYPLTVKVEPSVSGDASMEIEIQDAKSDKRFRMKVKLSRQQIGPIDRVSLVRSGRQGGSAIFDYLEIRSK